MKITKEAKKFYKETFNVDIEKEAQKMYDFTAKYDKIFTKEDLKKEFKDDNKILSYCSSFLYGMVKSFHKSNMWLAVVLSENSLLSDFHKNLKPYLDIYDKTEDNFEFYKELLKAKKDTLVEDTIILSNQLSQIEKSVQ